MWYIGQKVVCVKPHSSGVLVLDKIYTVQGIKNCRCAVNLNVGIAATQTEKHAGGTMCYGCNTDLSDSIQYFAANRFVPLSEFYANETAVDEMVKESQENLYQK